MLAGSDGPKGRASTADRTTADGGAVPPPLLAGLHQAPRQLDGAPVAHPVGDLHRSPVRERGTAGLRRRGPAVLSESSWASCFINRDGSGAASRAAPQGQ